MDRFVIADDAVKIENDRFEHWDRPDLSYFNRVITPDLYQLGREIAQASGACSLFVGNRRRRSNRMSGFARTNEKY
jgi:hypothetical protein